MKATDSTAELWERLADARALCPDMRIGQMLATTGMLAEDETGHSLWDVEDAQYAAALARLAADLARIRTDSPEFRLHRRHYFPLPLGEGNHCRAIAS